MLYQIPVNLTQWLRDAQAEIQNYSNLADKEAAAYIQLRFPHPDEPRPFLESDSGEFIPVPTTVSRAQSPDDSMRVQRAKNAAALQIIKARIRYYLHKRHFLSNLSHLITEILGGPNPNISGPAPLENGEGGVSVAVAAATAEAESQRSVEEMNNIILVSMKHWLKDRGINVSHSASFSLNEPDSRSNLTLSDPYMTLLSPNNICNEHSRVELVRGFTLLRASKLHVLEQSQLHFKSVDSALALLEVDPNSVEDDTSTIDDQSLTMSTLHKELDRGVSSKSVGRLSDIGSVKGKSTVGGEKSPGGNSSITASNYSKKSLPKVEEMPPTPTPEDDDLTETQSVPIAKPKVEEVSVAVDPFRELIKNGEDQSFKKQVKILQRSGLLPPSGEDESQDGEDDNLLGQKLNALKGQQGNGRPGGRQITRNQYLCFKHHFFMPDFEQQVRSLYLPALFSEFNERENDESLNNYLTTKTLRSPQLQQFQRRISKVPSSCISSTEKILFVIYSASKLFLQYCFNAQTKCG